MDTQQYSAFRWSPATDRAIKARTVDDYLRAVESTFSPKLKKRFQCLLADIDFGLLVSDARAILPSLDVLTELVAAHLAATPGLALEDLIQDIAFILERGPIYRQLTPQRKLREERAHARALRQLPPSLRTAGIEQASLLEVSNGN